MQFDHVQCPTDLGGGRDMHRNSSRAPPRTEDVHMFRNLISSGAIHGAHS